MLGPSSQGLYHGVLPLCWLQTGEDPLLVDQSMGELDQKNLSAREFLDQISKILIIGFFLWVDFKGKLDPPLPDKVLVVSEQKSLPVHGPVWFIGLLQLLILFHQNRNYSRRFSKYGSPPNQPWVLWTFREAIERHKKHFNKKQNKNSQGGSRSRLSPIQLLFLFTCKEPAGRHKAWV